MIQTLKSKSQAIREIDRKGLLYGLAAVFGFYVLLYVYVVSFHDSAIRHLESKLAHQRIPIAAPDQIELPFDHGSQQKDIPILIEGVYEKTQLGNLPIIRPKDKQTSFNGYKRPFSLNTDGKPVLAVIVKDFGLSKSTSETAFDILPPEVTYVLSPYADMAPEWAKILRQSGREFWANVPFETVGESYADSGIFTIFTKASFVKNQKALHQALVRVQSYPGISSTLITDGVMEYDDSQIRKVAEEIFGRGLGYLELNPKAPSLLGNIALSKNTPYVKADMELTFLPNQNPFERVEAILNARGYAVVVVENYPNNIKRTAEWLLKVAQSDYQLAPASAIYDLPLLLSQKNNEAVEVQPRAPDHAGDLLTTDKAAAPKPYE